IVYGDPQYLPLDEQHPLSVTNPYGRSKLMSEEILRDLHSADSSWAITVLRYFNPIGAHETGLIGEDPAGTPSNLLPFIAQVAVGKLPHLNVYGNNYPTIDGTGVRDYIHVTDLARGHVKALERHFQHAGSEHLVINLGTGRGHSVLEVVHAFERASGQSVPYVLMPRRLGDVASCYAKTDKAKILLDWHAEFDIARMCADAWRWQSRHPNGYAD
ncbi:MAG: UDP-glucose 4-epimerase GalE, partial [Comamonas sp.]